MPDQQRIVHVQLDERTMVRRRAEVEHERAVAIYDLLEENYFAPANFEGPYALHLRLEDNRLLLDIRSQAGDALCEVPLPLKQFQSIVKDYFMICESYYAAIKTAAPSHIEAIDMGRRGLHDEGAEMLKARLAGRIEVDLNTARRLFTLVCVLHIRG